MGIREVFWCVCSTGGVLGVVSGKVDNVGRELGLGQVLVEHFVEIPEEEKEEEEEAGKEKGGEGKG